MRAKSSKILILTTAYLPQVGGSELAIKNVTERLPELEFDLITARASAALPTHERIGNVNVYRVGDSFGRLSFLLPKNFLPLAVFFKARAIMARQGRYAVIHAFQASQAAGGGWLLKWLFPRIPFVVTVQEGKVLGEQSLLTRVFRRFIFQKADHATAISRYLADYSRAQNKTLPVEIIPNGVDVRAFQKNGDRNGKTVVTVSRLVEKNAVGDLIEAVSLVKKDINDVRLVIIGDGPQRSRLEKQVRSLGLQGDVEFAGEVQNEDLPAYLAKADVFVRPSLSEGLGISFLEAMAAGVPIVGTPVGGIPDFLKDGETGLFCRPGDPADIGSAIVRLLTDSDLRARLSQHSRELVIQKYDWDTIAREYKNLYERITA